MILNDEEIKERVESPLNLMNRLRKTSETKTISPCLPSASDLVNNLDEKIENGTIKQQAFGIMNDAMKELKLRIPEISKPEKLAQIARDMNQIVTARQDTDRDKPAQIVIYAPQVINENTFETVVVRE